MKLRLDQILHRKQDGTIDVIEEIQRRKQSKRGAGIELGWHGSSEYSRLQRSEVRLQSENLKSEGRMQIDEIR